MEKETDVTVLDVTLIEPQLKHPTIFKLFEELRDGESFIIKNDHDPKPLRYQLLAEKGEIFDWQYLENGPAKWRIKITKKGLNAQKGEITNKLSGESVGNIVAQNPDKIDVFKKYGIDFCCGGDKTLREACESANINEDEIVAELNDDNIKPASGQENTFLNQKTKDWSVDFLIDYIVNIHHTFLRVHIPEATEYIEKVANVHGGNHPEVVKIRELFAKMNSILTPHLDYEEKDLFPRIKNLKNTVNTSTHTDKVNNTVSETQAILKEIENIISEHEETGNILKEMDALSSHYSTPADACASYKYIYKSLREISDDIMIHVHLENNILFKKIH